MAFPFSTDSFAGFTSTHTLATDNHASQSNAEQAAIVAIENKVGIGASTPVNNTFLAGNGTGTSTWRAATAADVGLGNVSNVSESTILQAVYPVGSIYIEATGVNPATIFGFGTWAAIGKGQFLVGAGTSDQTFTAGASGGESNHTLAVSELPAHSHTVTDPGHTHTVTAGGTQKPQGTGASNAAGIDNSTTSSNITGITNQNTGGGSSHNNLPPWLCVYFWQRTA